MIAATSGAPSVTDWIGVGLTAALVAITAVYVWQTGRMAGRMEQQVDAMREQQDRAELARLREKSDRAAYACLEALNRLLDAYAGRHPAAVEQVHFVKAKIALGQHAPLVHDTEVADRVRATVAVMHVAGYDPEQMEKQRLNPGVARVVAQEVAKALAAVLHGYLSERGVPPSAWRRNEGDGHGARFPGPGEAHSWMIAMCRRDE